MRHDATLLTWSAVALIGAAAVVGLTRSVPTPEGRGPVAAILAPVSGFKLRQGGATSVRIRVAPGDHPLDSWKLHLVGPHGLAQELAAGQEGVLDKTVSEIAADTLAPGETYTLVLDTRDAAGRMATGRIDVLIANPQYGLMPLESGDRLGRTFAGTAMDGSGNLLAFGGSGPHQVILTDARTGMFRAVNAPVASSEGFHLSADGERFFFSGNFSDFFAIASFPPQDPGHVTPGPQTKLGFLSRLTGRGRASPFNHHSTSTPWANNPDGTLEYFLYDESTKEVRQLTSGPNVIDYSAQCPAVIGSGPPDHC